MQTKTLILLGLLCLSQTAIAMVSTQYAINWDMIGGGGGCPALRTSWTK